MRLSATRALLLAAGSFVVAFALAGTDAAKAGRPNAAWESMKTLQGEWEGLYAGKMKTKVSYRLVSNGTALMEALVSPDSTDMVTMYHPDGDRVAMTHYCSENTQSRMRAAGGANPKRLVFSFVDATNMPAPDAMHMTGLVVTFRDAGHFTQEWTSSAKGKQETGRFEFTRKR